MGTLKLNSKLNFQRVFFGKGGGGGERKKKHECNKLMDIFSRAIHFFNLMALSFFVVCGARWVFIVT